MCGWVSHFRCKIEAKCSDGQWFLWIKKWPYRMNLLSLNAAVEWLHVLDLDGAAFVNYYYLYFI